MTTMRLLRTVCLGGCALVSISSCGAGQATSTANVTSVVTTAAPSSTPSSTAVPTLQDWVSAQRANLQGIEEVLDVEDTTQNLTRSEGHASAMLDYLSRTPPAPVTESAGVEFNDAMAQLRRWASVVAIETDLDKVRAAYDDYTPGAQKFREAIAAVGETSSSSSSGADNG